MPPLNASTKCYQQLIAQEVWLPIQEVSLSLRILQRKDGHHMTQGYKCKHLELVHIQMRHKLLGFIMDYSKYWEIETFGLI